MRKLLLIRHGETSHTELRMFSGHENVPLTKSGVKQALALAKKMKKIKVERVYSSDLKRAYQTARLIFPAKRVLKRRGLREIDFGDFSGHTWDAVNKRYPALYEEWEKDPANLVIPGGEGISGFYNRVVSCFKKIQRENHRHDTVAIVSHGGPIRMIMLYLKGEGLDKFWSIEVETCELKQIRIK